MKPNFPTTQKLWATLGMFLVVVLTIVGKGYESLVTAAVFGAVIAVASYCAEVEPAVEKVAVKRQVKAKIYKQKNMKK